VPPLVIAHRGDSHDHPENTAAAFAAALQLGLEAIELDVQLTRDGHAVVLHDPTLDRTTSGRGLVKDFTLAEVRALSAGYPSRFGDRFAGERISTLAEILGMVRDRARVLIEIKPDAVTENEDDGIEVRTIADVVRTRMEKDVALISFSHRALQRCRKHAPAIVRGHLFHEGRPGEMMAAVHDVAAEVALPEKDLLSDELRDLAREAGVKLATWVVDDPEDLKRLARFDLFGIASNRPGLLLDALKGIEQP
jgi:glycerophosphoryl diester phosphodiesterase